MTWLDLPPGWIATRVRSPLVAAARPASWDGQFLPNLVLAVEPVDEPWLEYADRSIATLVDRLSVPLLADAQFEDGWFQVVVAHELFGRQLTLVQRHVGGAGQAVVASYTVADVDWPGLCRQVLASVATLRAPS